MEEMRKAYPMGDMVMYERKPSPLAGKTVVITDVYKRQVGLLILCNFLHSFSWRVSRDQDIFTMLTLVFIRAKCITSLRIRPLLNVILRICYPLLRLINVVRGF